jgi:AcrR family transcriptional regulator
MSIRRETELRKKDQTIASIIEATQLLVMDGSESLPTVREVAKRSGYSIGSIYRNFTSVQDIVAQIVVRSQISTAKKIEAMVAQHSPDDGVDVFCSNLRGKFFSLIEQHNPRLVRFVFKMALNNARHADILHVASDRMVNPLLAMIARDRSGTFQQLSEKQVRLLARTTVFMVRSPLLEGNAFFGTPEHRAMVYNQMLKSLKAEIS